MEVQNSFPVGELKDRYGISKQGIINRRKYLKISTYKIGNKSYITEDDLDLLDRLHQFLNKNPTASMQDFRQEQSSESKLVGVPTDRSSESTLPTVPIEPTSLTILDNQNVTRMSLDSNTIEEIAYKFQRSNPLWYMNILENARASNWLLTTSEVRELIGVKPKTKKGEKTYKRGNWLFIKSGRIGNQTAWKVIKEES
jgi:hypothetical protein